MLFIALLVTSCKEDVDLITPDLDLIERVKSTEILLRNNTWKFDDLMVQVKYPMQAIPLLSNVADENGMVQPGKYYATDIFGNEQRQNFYSYQFTVAKMLQDTTNTGLYNELGFYRIVDRTRIRINTDSTGLDTYTYKLTNNDRNFVITSDHLTNEKVSDAVNEQILNSILSGKPSDIANKVVDKILGNEKLQDTIQQVLYDLIHGKIEEITQDPDAIAEKIATVIVGKLKEVDWETLVYDKVYEILDELKIDNPEYVAQILAEQIANRIQTGISQAEIYNAIYPILKQFEDEALPALVPVLSEAIYNKITEVFTVENIYTKIYPIWTAFSAIDSTAIVQFADTLGTVLTDHFFDADTLAVKLEPFVETLQSTSSLQIPALAQQIIDETLKPLVDSLNAKFPGLELAPDWNQIKPVLTSALTVLKSQLSGMTIEEGAAQLAQSIVSIMETVISNGVATAIFALQDIPAEQASTVVASWIVNLIEVAEPEIVAFLEAKLNEIIALFNAEEIAEELSAIIYSKILEVFSPENIYMIVLPIIQQINQVNIENVAQIITEWLFELNLVDPGVLEEQLQAAIAAKLGDMIGNVNVDEVTQIIVDWLLSSGLVQNIDGDVLKMVLEIKTYQLIIDIGKHINAIETIELTIGR